MICAAIAPEQGLFLLEEGNVMDQKSRNIFSTEIKCDARTFFINGDDSASDKNLTSPDVAQMAFESVFSDVMRYSTPRERYNRLLSEG